MLHQLSCFGRMGLRYTRTQSPFASPASAIVPLCGRMNPSTRSCMSSTCTSKCRLMATIRSRIRLCRDMFTVSRTAPAVATFSCTEPDPIAHLARRPDSPRTSFQTITIAAEMMRDFWRATGLHRVSLFELNLCKRPIIVLHLPLNVQRFQQLHELFILLSFLIFPPFHFPTFLTIHVAKDCIIHSYLFIGSTAKTRAPIILESSTPTTVMSIRFAIILRRAPPLSIIWLFSNNVFEGIGRVIYLSYALTVP